MLDFVGRKVRANDVTKVVPHRGDIIKCCLPGKLTPTDVRDIVLNFLVNGYFS